MTRNPGKLIPADFTATPSLDAVPAVAWSHELDEQQPRRHRRARHERRRPARGHRPRPRGARLRRLRGEARHDARAAAREPPAHRASSARAPSRRARHRRPARRGGGLRAGDLAFGRIGLRVPSIGSADAADAGPGARGGRDPRPLPVQRAAAEAEGHPARARRAAPRRGRPRRGIRRRRDRHRHRARREHRTRPREHPARATSPPTDIADVAVALGARFGFEVEVFDRQQLIDLGCGGLLGVNAGSAEEPRMVKLRYTPAGDVQRAPRPRRQGHHVRLGRHQPEAVATRCTCS